MMRWGTTEECDFQCPENPVLQLFKAFDKFGIEGKWYYRKCPIMN